MERRELLEVITKSNMRYLFLDDPEISPIETILFCDGKKTVLEERNFRFMDGERERLAVVCSFKDIGIDSFKTGIFERAQMLLPGIYLPCEEDFNALILYYVFLYAQRNNWLKKNAKKILMKRMDLGSEEELAEWLAEYLKKNRWHFKIREIVDIPVQIKNGMTGLEKVQAKSKLITLKIKRKLTLRTLTVKTKLHKAFLEKKYLRYMENTGAVGKKYVVLNKGMGGSSGCTLIKEEKDNQDWFIKGNELKEYGGIHNEIRAQKYVQDKSEDKEWFLEMADQDSKEVWIKYPFTQWDTMDRYLQKKKLNDAEKKEFGLFLIKVLDRLYQLRMVHNDLRIENIMVKIRNNEEDQSEMIDGFLLTDFGCCSIKGEIPWNMGNFWGRFMASFVGGEYRYDERILDDAVSAWVTYSNIGGDETDEIASAIRERIGRLYLNI